MDERIPLAPDRFTVDRIEGDYLVLEGSDGRTVDLPLSLAPAEVKGGDVVFLELEKSADWSRITIRIDVEGALEAREVVAARLDRLRTRDPGGDRIE